MNVRLDERLWRRLVRWLTRDRPAPEVPLCDFARLAFEVRPGDVLLVEGRTHIGDVIKVITQSPWSHAALYVGRLFDVADSNLRAQLARHHHGSVEEQLIIEAVLGEGTVVHPLRQYRHDHLRICRPRGLAPLDAQSVIGHAIAHLGNDYDTRQLLDLARFLFPYGVLPRRWRSSLFEHNAGDPTRTVCSSLLAEAFARVDYPVLPFIRRAEDGGLRLFRRNPKLFAPRDFDYSPYFDIMKYPYLDANEVRAYRDLPWEHEVICNDAADCAAAPAAPLADTPPKLGSPTPGTAPTPIDGHGEGPGVVPVGTLARLRRLLPHHDPEMPS